MEVSILIDLDSADFHHDVRASILDLPANTAFRAQVSVMNGHYTGPPSDTIDFKTSEGGKCTIHHKFVGFFHDLS